MWHALLWHALHCWRVAFSFLKEIEYKQPPSRPRMLACTHFQQRRTKARNTFCAAASASF
jgi:hypothetical protein